MAKRLTDNAKWNKVWFRKLTPTEKCFWMYLTDNCNHAGIWEVDWETAEHFINSKLDIPELIKAFEKQIEVLDNGKKWFIRDFVEFQYNVTIDKLNPLNKVHASVLLILQKYGLSSENKPLASPMQGSKDKDKEKDKDKDKEKDKDSKVFAETILTTWNDFAQQNSLPKILEITDKRKTAILTRSKEKQFNLTKILEKITESKFMLGNNNRGWKVDFDFVFCSPNNYLKILEDKYKFSAAPQQQTKTLEVNAV